MLDENNLPNYQPTDRFAAPPSAPIPPPDLEEGVGEAGEQRVMRSKVREKNDNPPAQEEKPRSFLSRLFKKRTPAATTKSTDQDWRPLDFSNGTFKDKELFESRRKLEYNLKKDLKSVLPKLSQRQAVADAVLQIRQRGIGRKEFKKKIDKLVQDGKLKKFQARELKNKYHAY